MSPYIVTTKRRDADGGWSGLPPRHVVVSRRAVATLEEAQTAHDQLLAEHGKVGGFLNARWSKVTVGPLPDGTVIEVEPTTRSPLVAWLTRNGTPMSWDTYPWTTEQVLVAYNAAQETP